MDDVTHRRRVNLRAVIDSRGSPTAVAKVLKLSGPSWLSQLTHGTRPFSEKTARKFEQALGLKSGYLDQDHYNQLSGARVNVDVPLVSGVLEAVNSALADAGLTLTVSQLGAVADVVFDQAVKHGSIDGDLVRKIVALIGRST